MKCKTLRENLKLEVIEKWLKDSDCDVRTAAMNACQGRDVPIEVIETGLIAQKNINWNDFPTCQKRGICCIKETYSHVETTYKDIQHTEFTTTTRTRWKIDNEIPVFKGDGREYIERIINFTE